MIEGLDEGARQHLLQRGRRLELATLGWNVVGVVVLAYAAIEARSVALAGFGLDSVIEIGASTVVLWELADVAQTRQRSAMRLIGSAFVGLSVYLAFQSTVVLIVGFRPHHSTLGIIWTALTVCPCRRQVDNGSSVGQPGLASRGPDHNDRRRARHRRAHRARAKRVLRMVVGRSSCWICFALLRVS